MSLILIIILNLFYIEYREKFYQIIKLIEKEREKSEFFPVGKKPSTKLKINIHDNKW